MSEEVHLRVGGRMSVSKETTVVKEMDQSKLNDIQTVLDSQDKLLGTHTEQLGSLETRVDSVAEWMGAIKDWVPQQTGALVADMKVQEERLTKLEIKELNLIQARPVVSLTPQPITPVVIPADDPKKAERDWVHYFGEKHASLENAYNNLEEVFHVYAATLKQDTQKEIIAAVPVPKSTIPLWVTIGLTFSTQIVHLLHYITHLH